jgi:hypothetical protein
VPDVQRKRSDAAGPSVPAPPPAAAPSGRRLLAPANDNAMAPLRRILRAAVFVAIGAALAWVLRMTLG